jgi:hypothetical protein
MPWKRITPSEFTALVAAVAALVSAIAALVGAVVARVAARSRA